MRIHALAALLLAFLPLSGCFSSGGSDDFDFVPGTDFEPTGRIIHLKASVIDLDQVIFDGLNTWLWAFCFGPVDPNDEVSKSAIVPFTPLEGDKPFPSVPDGMTACSVPGPTLRVRQGDTVKVEFSHSHFHPHTIHWHGQFVPWEADGAPGVTQDSVESGGTFTYEFVAKRAGTLWYHCHVDTQLHVQQGLYGMMIVEPQDTKWEPKDIDEEFVMVISTMNRNTVEAVGTSRHSHPPGCASGFPAPCENPPSQAGKPDIFLLNGHSYPLTMEQKESLYVVNEGDRIRLRILNAGETVEQIHPHGHDMLVVAKDGNPLAPDAQYYADTLNIGPAERYDVVMVMDNPGPWMIHTHVSSHETNCNKSPGGMHTMLVYEEYLTQMHQFKAEAPAQCAFGSQLSLPSDFVDGAKFHMTSGAVPIPNLPTTGAPTEQWSFPIEQPCAVQRISFRAYYDTTSPAAAQMNLTVQLNRTGNVPDRTIYLTGSSRDATYVIEKDGLVTIPATPGNYTVTARGTVPEGTLELDVVVDYYESFEESKIGHLTYKTSGCSGYT